MANMKRLYRTAIVASIAVVTVGVVGALVPALLEFTIPLVNVPISVGGVATLGVGIFLGETAADKLKVKS